MIKKLFAVAVLAVFSFCVKADLTIDNVKVGGSGSMPAGVTWNPPLLTIGSGDHTLSGTSGSVMVLVDSTSETTLTLDNVNLDASGRSDSYMWDAKSPFAVNCLRLKLRLVGSNVLKGAAYAPGVKVVSGSRLCIMNGSAGTGTLEATGGTGAAGIGTGSGDIAAAPGDVEIQSGVVVAVGGPGAAGIGGGSGCQGGNVWVTGGTVLARGDSGNLANDIGGGAMSGASNPLVVSGGSVIAPRHPDARDASGATVHAVTIIGLPRDAYITGVSGLDGYTLTGSRSDADGRVGVWLKNGSYFFTMTIGGENRDVYVVVAGGDVTVRGDLTGVTINGVDAAYGAGSDPAHPHEGWKYDGDPGSGSYGRVSLEGDSGARYVISGVNRSGKVRIGTDTSCDIVMRNLELEASDALFTLSSSRNCRLLLDGTNRLHLASGDASGAVVLLAPSQLTIDAYDGKPVDGAVLEVVTRSSIGLALTSGGSFSGTARLTVAGGRVDAYSENMPAIGLRKSDEGHVFDVVVNGGYLKCKRNSSRIPAIGMAELGYPGRFLFTVNDGTVDAREYEDRLGAIRAADITINGGSVCSSATPRPINANSNSLTRVEFTVPKDHGSTNEPFWRWPENKPIPCLTRNLGRNYNYGLKEIYPVDNRFVFWLPVGAAETEAWFGGATASFSVDYQDSISGVTLNRNPLRIDRVEVSRGSGAGWVFDTNTLQVVLSHKSRYTIDGTNSLGGTFRVLGSAELTLDGLYLDAGTRVTNVVSAPAISIASNATVALNIKGENAVMGYYAPAVAVPETAALVIDSVTNEPNRAILAAGSSFKGSTKYPVFGAVDAMDFGTVEFRGATVRSDRRQEDADVRIGLGVNSSSMRPGARGRVLVRGGTILYGPSMDIVCGSQETNLVTGGSVRVHGFNRAVNAAGSNLVEVVIEDLDAGSKVGFKYLDGYSDRDVYADDGGRAYVYLPENGDFGFVVNGYGYNVHTGSAGGGSVTATRVRLFTGVYVDGVDVCVGRGNGWYLDSLTGSVVFTNSVPHKLSGRSQDLRIRALSPEMQTLTLDGLSLENTGSPMEVSGSLLLRLSGENSLIARSTNSSGIKVLESASLTIADGEHGSLRVAGRDNGAAIGGCTGGTTGRIRITGGSISAVGGGNAAAIGSGYGGATGPIEILGGTITATGGVYAAAIGAGQGSSSGPITITGGRINAVAGQGAAAIGTGYNEASDVSRPPVDIRIGGGTINLDGYRLGCSLYSGVRPQEGSTTSVTGGSICTSWPMAEMVPELTSTNQVNVYALRIELPYGLEKEFPADVPLKIDGLAGYGANDIYAVDDVVQLYLPAGSYHFTVNGFRVDAVIEDQDVLVQAEGVGVAVDDVDVGALSGVGWNYDRESGVLAITNVYPESGTRHRIEGFCTNGLFSVQSVSGAVTVVEFGELQLEKNGARYNAFDRCGPLEILGGTVDLGDFNAPLTILGGSVRPGTFTIAPSNGTDRVYHVIVGGFFDREEKSMERIPGYDYGLDDLYPDGAGNIHLWLPSAASTRLVVGGFAYNADITNDHVVARREAAGVTVDGVDVSRGRGDGWEYDPEQSVPTLSVQGNATARCLGGTNATALAVYAESGSRLRFDRFRLAPSGTGDAMLFGIDGLTLSGGTADINGIDLRGDGSLFISGGSFRISRLLNVDGVKNPGGEPLHPVDVHGNRPGAEVPVSGIPGYDGSGIFADETGTIHLWLPRDRDISFVAGGYRYRAPAGDGAVDAERLTYGITVDGADLAAGAGDGWTFDPHTSVVTLADSRKFGITGSNTVDNIGFMVGADTRVVMTNLVLLPTNRPAFTVRSASSANLDFSGTNRIMEILVPDSTRICIGEKDTEIDSELTVTARPGNAAIGGQPGTIAGEVYIQGGTVRAYGGEKAAGIGAGAYGGLDYVNIGRAVVYAQGGSNGAGIGLGWLGSSMKNAIAIVSGTVIPVGGDGAADIGLGADPMEGEEFIGTPVVRILGGSVLSSGERVDPAASNATARVWAVAFGMPGVDESTPVDMSFFEGGERWQSYGPVYVRNGRIVLWMVNGSYHVQLGTKRFKFTVADADVNAEPEVPLNECRVYVNGVDIGYGLGKGWRFDTSGLAAKDRSVAFTEPGTYTVTGADPAIAVRFTSDKDITLFLDNYRAKWRTEDGHATGLGYFAEIEATSAGIVNVFLKGTNTVNGIYAEPGAKVCIDSAPGYGVTNAMLTTRGYAGAGIGARLPWQQNGNLGRAGVFEIRGGLVVADVSNDRMSSFVDAAGVGSMGTNGFNCVFVKGGTLVAKGSGGELPDIGGDPDNGVGPCDVCISGGTVNGSVRPQPRNSRDDGVAVYRVNCRYPEAYHPVSITYSTLPSEFGTKDMMTDGDGYLRLYLPTRGDFYRWLDGNYAWRAVVHADYVSAHLVPQVTVNGVPHWAGSGDGWTYDRDSGILLLNSKIPYIVSGSNDEEVVRLKIHGAGKVTLAGVHLHSYHDDVLTIGDNNVYTPHTETVELLGHNSIDAFFGRAVMVGYSAHLIIDAATNDYDYATLSCIVDQRSTAIGGPCYGDRRITIRGGDVYAKGGTQYGAGIGWDAPDYEETWYHNCNNVISIEGGRVAAFGRGGACGIGGSESSGAGEVLITGGTVYAQTVPSSSGAIGNYSTAHDGSDSVTIDGGSVQVSGAIIPAPTNSLEQAVYKVTVTGLVANAAIADLNRYRPQGAPEGYRYGLKDVWADDGGNAYFWFANGTYDFDVVPHGAAGNAYTVTVDNADAIATLKGGLPASMRILGLVQTAADKWKVTVQAEPASAAAYVSVGGSAVAGGPFRKEFFASVAYGEPDGNGRIEITVTMPSPIPASSFIRAVER